METVFTSANYSPSQPLSADAAGASFTAMKRHRTASLELRFFDGDASTHVIDAEPFLVGRGDSARLRLRGNLISRTHVVVRRCAEGSSLFQIEDTGSSNGSFLSTGERLLPGVPRELRDGDLVILGGPVPREGGVVLAFREEQPSDENARRTAAPSATVSAAAEGYTPASDSDVDSEEDEALRHFFQAINSEEDEADEAAAAAEVVAPAIRTACSTAQPPTAEPPLAVPPQPPATSPPATAAADLPAAAGAPSLTPAGGTAAARRPAPAAPSALLEGFAAKPRDAQHASAACSHSARWLEGSDGGQLASRWGAPPFSVLDARKGYWKDRRAYWEHTYRIQSECGRADNLLGYKGLGGVAARGTSVFCPVLCELVYRWFVPAGGSVLDPFAGGSVRGCVAARLGLHYTGLDLSSAQVDENRRQAARMHALASTARARWTEPTWHAADSRTLDSMPEVGRGFDALFSCPPCVRARPVGCALLHTPSCLRWVDAYYWMQPRAATSAPAALGAATAGAPLPTADDARACVCVGRYYDLERYSGDPRDLSEAQTYAAFLQGYRDIIGRALSRLARNRFACFVVGEIRDPDGFCRNFVGDTIAAFEAHGARLYNHAVMMLPLASLPMRASSAFNASAKLGTCHQHVLVFYNGLHPNRDVKGLALHNASKALEWY